MTSEHARLLLARLDDRLDPDLNLILVGAPAAAVQLGQGAT